MRIGSKFCNLQLELSSDNKSQSDVIDRPLSSISSSGLSSIQIPRTRYLYYTTRLGSASFIFRSVSGQCRDNIKFNVLRVRTKVIFVLLGLAGLSGGRRPVF